jgi:4-hydroxy-3-methylbut-2-en-1-yl diphosphate reductase
LQSPPKDDICYATQNRQNAVKEMARQVDVILVIGSQNSSNSQRLREVSVAAGVTAYLINNEDEIDPKWLEGKEVVGVTAGASAPEEFVSRVISYLRSMGATEIDEIKADDENVHFSMPQELMTQGKGPIGLRR